MTGRHRMWDGTDHVEVDVPVSGGENVMVPVIRAVVHRPGDPTTILLQRRDDPSEPVRGRIEIPGGRWRAGERPDEALRREVEEETGLVVHRIDGVQDHDVDRRRSIAAVTPLVVVAGTEGAFPAIHVVLIAEADGTPRPQAGETSDVRWWTLGDVRGLLAAEPEAFIPSSAVALTVYLMRMGSP